MQPSVEVGSTEKEWNEIKAGMIFCPVLWLLVELEIYTYIIYIYIYIYIYIKRVFNTT